MVELVQSLGGIAKKSGPRITQYTHNDELRYCGGYLTAEQLALEGRSAPLPGCRKALYQTLQACMRKCGITIPDLRVVPAPRGMN